MSTYALNLAFAAVLAVTSIAGLGLLVLPRRVASPPVAVAAGALIVVWAVSVAYMTLRTGTGLGVRLNLLPLLFDGRGSAVDAVLNVFVFVPLGLLVAAVGIRFRMLLPGAFAVTLSIEIAQYLMDAGRTADINDLITNTVGACLGWALGALIVRARRARSARGVSPSNSVWASVGS